MTDHASNTHGEHTGHVQPVRAYAAVYVALIVLLGATVGVYYISTPWHFLNNIIAMTIAIIKATLVILVFMGVRYGTKLTWLYVAAGFLWLAIMFVFTLTDYLSRQWVPVRGF